MCACVFSPRPKLIPVQLAKVLERWPEATVWTRPFRDACLGSYVECPALTTSVLNSDAVACEFLNGALKSACRTSAGPVADIIDQKGHRFVRHAIA